MTEEITDKLRFWIGWTVFWAFIVGTIFGYLIFKVIE